VSSHPSAVASRINIYTAADDGGKHMLSNRLKIHQRSTLIHLLSIAILKDRCESYRREVVGMQVSKTSKESAERGNVCLTYLQYKELQLITFLLNLPILMI
jgi:hypothetical protein